MENLVSSLPAEKQALLRKRFYALVWNAAHAGADIQPVQFVEYHWQSATVESLEWMKDMPRVRIGGNLRRGDVENVRLLGGRERPVPLKNASLSLNRLMRPFVVRKARPVASESD